MENTVEGEGDFWFGQVGCTGCNKLYFPNAPCPNQSAHTDPGGCLYEDSGTDEDEEAKTEKKETEPEKSCNSPSTKIMSKESSRAEASKQQK